MRVEQQSEKRLMSCMSSQYYSELPNPSKITRRASSSAAAGGIFHRMPNVPSSKYNAIMMQYLRSERVQKSQSMTTHSLQ